MSILTDHFTSVIGVDTHAATHTYALIESSSGKLIDQRTFPTPPAGLGRATAWIGRRTGTDVGYRVVEAPTPSTKRLRGRGKTDTLDAITAARSTLIMGIERLRDRRASEVQTALKLLTVGREQMNAERLRVLNALTALVRAHDLGVDARRTLTPHQIATISSWRQRDEQLGATIARSEAVRLTKRIHVLDADLKTNRAQITDLVDEHSPAPVAMTGIGAVTAAMIMTVWPHHGRLRSEAALPKIAGTCPIPASSGNTV